MLRMTTLSLALVPLAGTMAVAQTVGFATLPPGAINNVQAQAIAKVVQENSDLKIRVTPYRGGGAVAAAVNRKRAEFGISDIVEMTDALTGSHRYKGRPHGNLRVAFRVLAFTVGMFVRKDSGITKMADLKGKRMSTRWSAFPNAIPLANATFATVGLQMPRDFVGVPTANIIRAANDFKAGKTDILFFAVGAPKVAEVNSAVGGIRLLGIDNSPAAVARMKAVRPDYFPVQVKPHPRLAGVLAPTWVLGSDLIIYVGAHVPDDVVYKFVKAVFPNKMALGKGHPSLFGFQPKQMGKQFSVAKYHPGAIKFFKEKGIWPGK